MNTFVVAGGTSGIGCQTARELLTAGHHVVILGRDKRKGEEALESFGPPRDRATFLPVDLSTHDGVRDAARQIDEVTDHIDGLAHSAAVFDTTGTRTADGLRLFFALSYLSRYHLTQLLLPKLLRAERPRVIMLTATLNQVPKLKPELFPYFERFGFMTAISQVNGACLYYADYLAKTHPQIFAGCATPGFVRTDLFKQAPWFIRATVALTGPFRANSVETGARNVVQALLSGEGSSAYMWNKAGDFNRKWPITVDPAIQKSIIDSSRQITGA